MSSPNKRHYPELWHFTCGHGRRALGKRGLLVAPIGHPLLGARLIWLTTEAEPDREATGLTMRFQRCDRMAYRYRVLQPDRCEPWIGCPFRDAAHPQIIADLESFGDPHHWWITIIPTLAELANDR